MVSVGHLVSAAGNCEACKVKDQWLDELKSENRRLLSLLTETEEASARTEPRDFMPIQGRSTRRMQIKQLEARQHKIAHPVKQVEVTDNEVVNS